MEIFIKTASVRISLVEQATGSNRQQDQDDCFVGGQAACKGSSMDETVVARSADSTGVHCSRTLCSQHSHWAGSNCAENTHMQSSAIIYSGLSCDAYWLASF